MSRVDALNLTHADHTWHEALNTDWGRLTGFHYSMTDESTVLCLAGG